MTATARIVSPVDGRLYAERALADGPRIATALAAAARAQQAWRQRTLAERADCCNAAVDALLAMGEAIVPELAWQIGRPVRDGPGELAGLAQRARHMIAIADEALAPIRPPGSAGEEGEIQREIRREPLGTVLVIAPWNYPYLTAVNSLVPALMAGNAVLLKHSTQTLLAGERFAQAFAAADLPDGLFQHLVLDHAQVRAIIESGQVRQVNFTGSVAAGRRIATIAAPAIVGVGLELGGKDPAYVRADADLSQTVDALVDGCFFNAGQSCCAVERIYVERSRYRAFVDAFVAATQAYRLGNPLEPGTTLGPMVTVEAAERVRQEIAAAVAQGARPLIDRALFEADAPGTAYLAPQVLVDVDHTMALMREETFGPVVGIMPVDGDDDALTLMNDSAFGLTASIWTTDHERARELGDALQTGTVFVNRCDHLDPALAWTGVKHSGRGVTLSRIGYETLTRPKSFHFRQLQ
jgi:acyl-CoA reductase-like NAD-dependent aldehyde dehydrogenase